jgi:hypothetical protein
MTEDQLLAQTLEQMVHVAFGVEKGARTRQSAEEIVDLLRSVADAAVNPSQEPFVPKVKDEYDGPQD